MGDKKEARKAERAARSTPTTDERSTPAASAEPKLPKTRAALMELHRQTRARRNAAPHGSAEHVEAITLIARIEVEIARIERAANPPLG